MSSFDIGLSGLSAALKALDVVGNNVSNASTEGYHKQVVDLSPSYSVLDGNTLVGGGVDITGITSIIDKYLEHEILRQQSTLNQTTQEASTLTDIETAFGELSTSSTGLSTYISNFFNAISDLSAHPDEISYQNEVLTTGEEMASQFNTLGKHLDNLKVETKSQVDDAVKQINMLSGQIAELNGNIQRIEMIGSQANNLVDQRDELISKMSELTGVQTQEMDNGVVNVSACGVSVVVGTNAINMEAGLRSDGKLGIAAAGTYAYDTTIDGGKIGGLLEIYNNTASGIHTSLDTLASSIIQQVNKCHVQGIGTDGSFTELNGQAMSSGSISDYVPPVNNGGSFFVRVTYTDPVTKKVTVTRQEISVSTTESLNDIANDITHNVTGLSATAYNNKLSIQADANYKFDFLPAVLSEPTAPTGTFAGSSSPTVSVSGTYTGDINQTFTFRVVGDDSVGNGNLKLEVKDGDGQVVDNLNIGSGYVAGDKLDFGEGITVAIGSGALSEDDSFKVDAYSDADTSGLLSTIGMNTFFTGTSATDMAVSSELTDNPGRVASASGADGTDNNNAMKLASLSDLKINDLNSMTISDYYQQLVTDIGEQASVKKTAQTNSEDLMLSLTNQESDVSGVDINDESAKMLVYEQMFQAAAKYISTVNNSLTSLMDIL
jgi:flagellar hook-associated protein 1 FlgK